MEGNFRLGLACKNESACDHIKLQGVFIIYTYICINFIFSFEEQQIGLRETNIFLYGVFHPQPGVLQIHSSLLSCPLAKFYDSSHKDLKYILVLSVWGFCHIDTNFFFRNVSCLFGLTNAIGFCMLLFYPIALLNSLIPAITKLLSVLYVDNHVI